jgi:Domain of unknown function (DUF4407)/CHAT domain
MVLALIPEARTKCAVGLDNCAKWGATLGKLLIAIAGAREEILREFPAERLRFQRLGWAVLISSGIGAVSMWFALADVVGLNPVLAVPLALLWGLVIIGIDRWLITPIRPRGPRRWAVAVLWLLLTVLLAGIISTPIVLRIFQPQVNNQIARINVQRTNAYLASQQYRQIAARVNQLQAQVAKQERVTSASVFALAGSSVDPPIQLLTQQLKTWLGREQTYYNMWQCQLYGTAPNGLRCQPGNGPLAQSSRQAYEQARQQVAIINSKIAERKNELPPGSATAASAAVYQAASSDLARARSQLQYYQMQQARLLDQYASTLPRTGLPVRLQALGELTSGKAKLQLVFFLILLLFLWIECLPVMVKLQQGPGNYALALRKASEYEPRRVSRRTRPRDRFQDRTGPVCAGAPELAAGKDVSRELRQPTAAMSGQGKTVLSATPVAPAGSAGARTSRDLDLGVPRVLSPGAADSAGGPPRARRRYLMGQCQESVPVGMPFSLLASIVLAAGPSHAELEPFDVPAEGRDVLLVMYAPALQLLGDQQQTVHVPADRDSRPVRFELRADTPGPRSVSITAWIGGTYLGELVMEITAERDRPPGPHREVLAEITTEPTEGAVSLVVHYDPKQNAYRFEFRDEDNPGEVPGSLTYDPGPLVERLVADLDDLTKGRTGYSPAQTRDYLVNAGAGLWSRLVPETLREQFWDRQHRIRQLTILADKDVVPWELLYPLDRGHDTGFLVEQFPVTRAIFGWRPTRTLRLRPARFVLPEGSLPKARDEIDAMRRLLDPGQPPSEVISALTPLTDLIGAGDFGLLHFACHNTYDALGGSSIKLGKVQFTPTLLEVAGIREVLKRSAPTVFINACRSAGLAATYNRLDGWASKFLEAGAGAFIGSLWAVSDGAAREFAEELYRLLQAGSPLGEAVMRARQAAASQPDDPTWLAYTVYGDPRAMVNQQP